MPFTNLTTLARQLPTVYENGANALRQYRHIKTGVRSSRPNLIYVTINERCNLRCKYCESWRAKGEDEVTTAAWTAALGELLRWTRRPKINFSGGEPFLRKDLFELLETCVGHKALTGVVTNGYAMTPDMAPRVVGLGLSNLNISIDSLDAEVFDFIRADGREGHTQRVVDSILRVVAEVRRQRSNLKVFLKTVVCGLNADSLIPLVEFVQEHGITGIMFQKLEPVFRGTVDYGNDWYKHTVLWPENPEPLASVSRQLIELKSRGAPIMNPISQLAAWPAYFKDPINGIGGPIGGDNLVNGRAKQPCRIGHTHLFLSHNGDIRLCGDFPVIGNIKTDSIPEVWTSDSAEELRQQIASCTKPCVKTCMLDRGLKETLSTFVKLTRPNKS